MTGTSRIIDSPRAHGSKVSPALGRTRAIQSGPNAHSLTEKGVEVSGVRSAFLNPFYVYSWIWMAILGLYALHWSTLYAPLQPGLVAFFAVTILLSTVFGAGLQRTLRALPPEDSRLDRKVPSKRITGLLVGGFLLEFAYVGSVPLVDVVFLHRGNYGEFPGIPVFDVILVTYSILHAARLAYRGSRSSGASRWSYMLQFLVIVLMFLLLFSRGAIMICIFMALLIFLSRVRLNGRRFFGALAAILITMYVFGGIGNLRSGGSFSDNSYIFGLAKISDGYPAFIPGQFLWTYMYFVSPLGNLNSLVAHLVPTFDFGNTLINLIPDFISKRAFPSFDAHTPIVTNYFNVSSGFATAWKYNGYLAMGLTFGVLSTLIPLAARAVATTRDRAPLAVACGVVAFMFFTNALSYSGISFALAYPILGSLVNVRRRRPRNLAIRR